MNWTVPLFNLEFGDLEHKVVQNVLESRWLTMGEEVAAFEREFSQKTGVAHALAVSNCTAGLHLALKGLGIGPGDEVVCPSLNFCAGPNVIVNSGADVRFADVTSEDDLCISPESAAACITPRTKAIMVMHYAGYPCDMNALRQLAQDNGLFLIEDAAHAPGASLNGKKCGTLGDVACFSFYSNKNFTTGEGGMVTTNDHELAERLRLLRSHGMTVATLDRHKGHAFQYDLSEPGYNYRLDEIRAALGRVQLGRLDGFNARRKKLTASYRAALKHVQQITLPFAAPRGESVHHILPVLLAPGQDRNNFMEALKSQGIQTSVHYPPAHMFTWYKDRYPGTRLPVTESIAERAVTLPLYAGMTEGQVSLVCDVIINYFSSKE
ncbi:DegT/DnrJ/EryC1/StrS family aminotransferase [Salidesulfovibrio onnuriiensis]|uniref:DegT/DnrJ/EryC1/StrS family aminotransferase n=1 Tax=Salidesulfovibrio onnuriiensis TaxID=2583823 RepID=UPI0011CA0635|nr:DegT/DnrJ/EryC1/StrS family aminotransferase [Salidesulfovibrio onnuriiensis]